MCGCGCEICPNHPNREKENWGEACDVCGQTYKDVWECVICGHNKTELHPCECGKHTESKF